MFRRHFFLLFALVVLALMVIAGVTKVGLTPSGKSSASSGAGVGQGSGGAAGAGGRKGGRGGGGAVVSMVEIKPDTFVDAIEVLGVAKGRRSVTLTAATTQLVQRVRFTEGQTVAKGAVLVELKTNEQDAGLAQSDAKLVQAARAYDRWKALSATGYASKAALDGYQAAWLSAKADVKAAQARQNDRLIRAPFAGTLGLSDVGPGALVNPGAPIVTLDDLSAIRVDFQVPERYLSRIAKGQAITAVVDAYPKDSIAGAIAMIDTRVDERTRALTARAEFPNPDRKLKPGMMVRVSIVKGSRQGLAAPEAAVSVQGESAFVYVLHTEGPKTMVEQRPVVTGLRQHNMVEITDGVRAGEHIVADGLNKIQPGQPVKIAGSGGRGGGHPGAQHERSHP